MLGTLILNYHKKSMIFLNKITVHLLVQDIKMFIGENFLV